jgi:hypothetical protein
MTGVAWTIERVWGMKDERGWGFMNLLSEISVLNFFATSYVMNIALKISLESSPINMD